MAIMQVLSKDVSTQIELLEKLKVQLEQELHLISSRDAEALMKLLDEKKETLSEIERLDDVIARSYQKAIEGGEALPQETQDKIEFAKVLLEQCQFRTEINQKAVEQGQLKLQHLRNLLVELRAKESLTYDKSGKTRGGLLGKGISA